MKAGWSIYPNLEAWIQMRYKTIGDFAKRIGVSRSTIRSLMTGEGGTSKYVIDLILKETGMAYEKCFRKK